MIPRQEFDLLVFDWDGTLMDSTATIVTSIQSAFRDLGLPEPAARDCRYVIGFGLKEALAYLAPGQTDAVVEHLIERYRHYFLSHEKQLILFEGVIDGLARLEEAGYMLAVATGKARNGLDRLLDLTGLRERFVVTRCADEAFSKPHPAMLNYILDFTAVHPTKALMIGDTTHDLELGKNAGVRSVAMTYGAHPIEEMLPHGPVAHFDDFPALTDWLLKRD